MTKKEFLDKSRNIHGYKYKYVNLNEKIILRDYITIEYQGVEYRQNVNKHLSGKCPEKNIVKKTKESFVSEAKKIWGDRFDYTDTIYLSSLEKVKIFDRWNNQYAEQIASLHIQGFEPKKINSETFISLSKIVSDYKYSYDRCIYSKKANQVLLTCPLHGDFSIIAFNHLKYGQGCTECDEFKFNKLVCKYLDRNGVLYHRQHIFQDCKNTNFLLPFDFYIPSIRTCIEFDGKQHYEPMAFFGGLEAYESIKLNDKIKDDYCEENYINLIRIRYDQYNNIENILQENLKTLIQKR